MSLQELKAEHDRKFVGSEVGEDWKMFNLRFNSGKPPAGALAIRKALPSLFKIRMLDTPTSILCWHDVLRNVGPVEHYQDLTGVLFVGLYFSKSERGTIAPTHFFVRETEHFRGTLDTWKDDIIFPRNVLRYTVCAIIPDDFPLSIKGERDPRNYRVPRLTYSQAKLQGLDLDAILPFMRNGGSK